MTAPKARAQTLLNIAVPLLLSVLGALFVLEVGFRLFYKLIPLDVCAADPIVGNYYCQPYFQYDKPIRIAYRYRPGFKTAGWWDPADPNMANAASETRPTGRSDAFWYEFSTDEQGFPNSEYKWREHYDIVVVGDSFTIRTAPRTWIELLQERTSMSVLTLGAPSWSTLNETEAIKGFGLDKRPGWVLLMFFEGNDLFNTAQYVERHATGLSWKEFDLQSVPLGRRLLLPHLLRYWIGRRGGSGTEMTPRYRYPVTASTEAGEIQMVFKDIHLLPLSADYDTLARSDELAATRRALIELKQACQAQGSRLLLVYIPSKEHVYWSRIWDSTDVNNILERTVTVSLSKGDSGTLVWQPKYLSYDTFQQNHAAQEELLGDLANEEGIEFLDLTPTFWQQAIEHGELYHYADPHWNQAGNQLAADTIAQYIQTH